MDEWAWDSTIPNCSVSWTTVIKVELKMGFLLIFLHPQKKIVISNESFFFRNEFEYSGDIFVKISEGNTFNWISDNDKKLNGVSLHIFPDEFFLNNDEKEMLQDTLDFSDGFGTFWFDKNNKFGTIKYQDWDDYYFRSKKGSLLVCLNLHLLNQSEKKSLFAY